MTEEEIIDLADKAGSFSMIQYGVTSAKIEWLQKFASLVAAKERKECAKVCDEHARVTLSLLEKDISANLYFWDGQEQAANRCAEAIRARGET